MFTSDEDREFWVNQSKPSTIMWPARHLRSQKIMKNQYQEKFNQIKPESYNKRKKKVKD